MEIGEDVRIKNTIVSKRNHIPAGFQIGYDTESDNNFMMVSGIVIVPKEYFSRE